VITVLLCDGHPLLRGGLRMILEGAAFHVVGEVSSAEEAERIVPAMRPRVLVMDVEAPGARSIAAIRKLRDGYPQTAVLVLTAEDGVGVLRASFLAGATGYVVKSATPAELVDAVQTLAGGGRYVHPTAGAAVADQLAAALTPTAAVSGPGGDLSKREVEVLTELAAGLTNAEIAEKLFLSVRTVENHRAHILQKLGASTRAELVRHAIDAGLLGNPGEPAQALPS
jgi:two-component system response regulator NreC